MPLRRHCAGIFLAVIWLVLLAVPATREHLTLQLMAPGHLRPGVPCADGQLRGPSGTCLGAPLEGRLAILQSNGPFTPLAADSRDFRAIAWELILSTQTFTPVSTKGRDAACGVAGSISNCGAMALRGESLDPGNAFFPWMEAVSEYDLGEDAAALVDLKRAVMCHRYEDYLTDYHFATFRVLEGNHLLSPWQIEQILWREGAVEDVDYDVETALSPPGAPVAATGSTDALMRYLLLQLGKLQQQTARSLQCRALGAALEMSAIEPDPDPVQPSYFLDDCQGLTPGCDILRNGPNPSTPSLGSPNRAEWDRVAKFLAQEYPTLSNPADLGSSTGWLMGERAECLLLASLPFGFALFLINRISLWRLGGEEVKGTALAIYGAAIGLAVLCMLFGFDFLMAHAYLAYPVGSLNSSSIEQPGFVLWMPHVAWSLVGLALLGSTYSRVIQMDFRERLRFEPDFSGGPNGTRSILMTFYWMVRSAIAILVWLIPPVLVLAITLAAFGWDTTNGYVLVPSEIGHLVTIPVTPCWISPYFSLMLAVCYLAPWLVYRSKNRKQMRRQARVRLNAVFAGYLLAASLLVLVAEVGRLEWQLQADRTIESSLNAGAGGAMPGWDYEIPG